MLLAAMILVSSDWTRSVVAAEGVYEPSMWTGPTLAIPGTIDRIEGWTKAREGFVLRRVSNVGRVVWNVDYEVEGSETPIPMYWLFGKQIVLQPGMLFFPIPVDGVDYPDAEGEVGTRESEWRMEARSVEDGRLVWHGSEIKYGEPMAALKDGRALFAVLANPLAAYRGKKEIWDLVCRDTATGKEVWATRPSVRFPVEMADSDWSAHQTRRHLWLYRRRSGSYPGFTLKVR